MLDDEEERDAEGWKCAGKKAERRSIDELRGRNGWDGAGWWTGGRRKGGNTWAKMRCKARIVESCRNKRGGGIRGGPSIEEREVDGGGRGCG